MSSLRHKIFVDYLDNKIC